MRVVHIGSLTRKDTDGGSTTEVDSHADTCVVGRHALVFHTLTGQSISQDTMKERGQLRKVVKQLVRL